MEAQAVPETVELNKCTVQQMETEAVLDAKLLPPVQVLRREHGEIHSSEQQSMQGMADNPGASQEAQDDAGDAKQMLREVIQCQMDVAECDAQKPDGAGN